MATPEPTTSVPTEPVPPADGRPVVIPEADEADRPGGEPAGRLQWGGLIAGAVAFGVLLALPVPEGLSPAGWRCAAVGVLMAVWWTTEALPLAATSLVPLVLFPLVGVADGAATSSPYAHPLIFLFLGGFVLAKGMERWGLHRRIALAVVAAVGTSPRRLVAGFATAAALLSMGISNTATALMMLPIAASVVALVDREREQGAADFAPAMFLGVAYACSVGGLGTLIGTPTNALLAGFVSESFGVEISFVGWMAFGVPLVVAGLGLVVLVLTRVAFKVQAGGGAASAAARELLASERRAMGPITMPETRVALIFGVVAALWVSGPLVSAAVPGVSDTVIAVAGALVLFAVPSGRGGRLLDWQTARDLPWGVLLLFGGGLSLAAAVADTGLAAWIGAQLSVVEALPTLAVVAAAVVVVVLLTELTSNTATAAAFLPVLAALAVGDPLALLLGTTAAASAAFMLPVATPPNAIVFGSGRVEIAQMVRAGVWLNVAFAVLIAVYAWAVAPVLGGTLLPDLAP